jgi:hypothetical protein
LSREAATALNHAMSNTEAKRRVELRKHSKITRAYNAGCTDKEETVFNGVKQDIVRFRAGELVLPDEDTFKYLKDSVDRRIELGIPGTLTDGYDCLADAVEKKKDELDKAEPDKK